MPRPISIKADEAKSETLANQHAAVTPSDTATFDESAILVCGTGDITVVDTQGAAVTYPSVPAYFLLPLRCVAVLATGTTATNIRRLW